MNVNETIEYIVDEKEKTVRAILRMPKTAVMEEFLNVLNKGTSSHLLFDGISFQENMLISGTYVGKAHCHPNDEFDAEKGEMLARARAIRAYLLEKQVVVNRFERMFNNVYSRISEMKEYTERTAEKMAERITSLD